MDEEIKRWTAQHSVHSGRIYPVLINARRAIHKFASVDRVRNCAVFFVTPG